MNRFAIILLSLGGLYAQSQPSSSTITISTSKPGARFSVDGAVYTSAANFNWPTGSKHTVFFVTDPPLAGQPGSMFQTAADGSVFQFGGWVDNAGLLTSSDTLIIVTADPHVTSLTANVSVSFKVSLNFFTAPDDVGGAPTCGAPGNTPQGILRVGLVYIGQQCFWSSSTILVPANSQINLAAFPYPGFVFLGWSVNLGPTDAFLRTYTVNGSVTIAPRFSPAKRVSFLTSPLGMNVLVDHTTLPTRSSPDVTGPCPVNESLPINPLTNFPPLCFGDLDLVPGSTHTLGAVGAQIDGHGKTWVFDSWSNGVAPNGLFTVDDNPSQPLVITGNFVRGAQVSLLTDPPGLPLSVDGRTNWPSYNFVWAQGSSHQVAAPATTVDKAGRKYTFMRWSNTTDAAQTISVDQAAVDDGLRVIASYSVLSRLVIQSSPPGLAIQVDGTSCQTPCTIDRDRGTKVQVTAPKTFAMGDGARLDFQSWSDGADSDHAYSIDSDTGTLTVNYRFAYRLSASGDPSNGAKFDFDPPSSDQYYPQDTTVVVKATANPGFKFRRWNGDLTGTFPSGPVSMVAPRSVVAALDRIPYIAPAGVRNAAGDTPSSSVAPGSIMTIFGESLAPETLVGRVNPLAQAIAGVTVTVGDRILPLLFVSAEQINAQVPSGLPDGDYTLLVHSTGQPDVSAKFTVARDAPGIFLQTVGTDQFLLALHKDGTPVTPDSPAAAGETVTILGTGFGPYSSVVIDGFFPPVPTPSVVDSVNVMVGDMPPQPTTSVAAAGFTGLTMTTFRLPDDLAGMATIPVAVTVNGVVSNTAMLPVH